MNRLPRYGLFVRNWNRDIVCFRLFLPFSTIATEKKPFPNTTMIDYLMKECGLSRERAIKASSHFPHINSTEKPDSVLKFFRERGFGDNHIRTLVSLLPRSLLSNVDKTLKPKFDFLEGLGISWPDIVALILKDPLILRRSVDDHLKPSVDFLRTHLGGDLDLPRALKRSWKLLSVNLRNSILPNIELLRSHGVSDKQMRTLFLKSPSIFTWNVAVLENVISRIEKFNVKFRPGMFIYAVFAVAKVSETRFEAKCKVWNSLGWSVEDVVSAFEKFPSLLMISEEKIRAAMNFFVNELGLKPNEIHPRMFALSLEKRIQPRHEILKILQKWGGRQGEVNLSAIADYSEREFFER
ncbi:transcription termination factor MTERF9, chloroplastic-like [Aristolochia californica]|uniref:transcription termination factor MTERF9, chloroplastic-like n=1 Tax=Aristolochia californica TaxID=171875 RepID=UPI0035DC612F